VCVWICVCGWVCGCVCGCVGVGVYYEVRKDVTFLRERGHVYREVT